MAVEMNHKDELISKPNATAEGRGSTKATRLKTILDTTSRDTPPESYTSNSQKEKICLEIVNNFRKIFTHQYPALRERLFLTARNEFGLEKC
eukprot:4682406-Ditylum_brightwellii.AAC.1